MPRRIVVVGGGAAGTTAAIEARKTDRSAEVFLITRESIPEYSRCGLPYAYSGIVPKLEALVTHPANFYESMSKVHLLLATECTELLSQERTIKAADLRTGTQKQLSYDALVIATGASPTLPLIKGIEKEGVFTIRTIDDIRKLKEHTKKHAGPVVIIGAGLIGMEMSEALAGGDLEVTVVEIMPEILSAVLDPDMATLVRERAERIGIKIIRNSTVTQVLGTTRAEGILTGGQSIMADTIIVAARVKPEVVVWQEAGVRTGEAGGIVVNRRMLTNIDDIYAAGDCVETECAITGRQLLLQLATTAVRQAVVAGTNAAGGSETYSPSTGVAATRLFGLEVASAGLTTETSKRLGLMPVSSRISASTRLPYMPNAKEITVKLLCDLQDRRLIGAQIVGEENATWRANFAALAMNMRLTVHEFARKETCYAPPVSPVWDPLTLAARALERKLEVATRAP
jgi:NADH oxidase (H2O2-forming)